LFYIYEAAGVRFIDAGVCARFIDHYLHMEIASFSAASFLMARKAEHFN
jgi:hypothetical protein